jgi:hypothetical protein
MIFDTEYNHHEMQTYSTEFIQKTESDGHQHFSDEIYSVTGFQIKFTRKIESFIVNDYLPTGLLVIISFISFLIPVDRIPGRMALLITIQLMLISASSSVRERGPKVSEKIKRKSKKHTLLNNNM